MTLFSSSVYEQRILTKTEIDFLKGLFLGESVYLRLMRIQIENSRDRLITIVRTNREMQVWFGENDFRYDFLPFSDQIHPKANVASSLGPITIEATIAGGGINNIILKGADFRSISDLSFLASLATWPVLDHPRLRSDTTSYDKWVSILGTYLNESIVINTASLESQILAVVTPMPGIQDLPPFLQEYSNKSDACRDYCNFLVCSNGMNFYGVYLASAAVCKQREDGSISVSGILTGKVTRYQIWISSTPHDGFYIVSEDAGAKFYADNVNNLFAKIVHDIREETICGTELGVTNLSPVSAKKWHTILIDYLFRR